MSKDGNVSNSLVKIEVPESIDNVVNNLTAKPTESIGQILSDCIFLVFGGLSQKAELRRIQYAFALKQFSEELENKIKMIPEDKRLDPNTHTVCSALDNMRYCVEESELRDMFSTLIANSIDKEISARVHPSYGDIIKQLTSFDAKLIFWMKEQEAIPAIKFQIQMNGKSDFIPIPSVYIEYDVESLERLQVSLENMSRLKIIDIIFERGYSDEKMYEKVSMTKKYIEDKREIESKMEKDRVLKELFGSIEITQFGKEFIDVCCGFGLK